MGKALESKEDAYFLLKKLGANSRLITHLQLVGEAADILVSKCKELSVPIDEKYVELGVAIHDAGKIKHSSELDNPGNAHEPTGEKMLLDCGVDPKIARCCMSHARYNKMEVTLEELLVALSDKLWKGKRVNDLELMVVDRMATIIGKDRWDIFTDLDATFEEIASGGVDRLNRSK